MKKEHTSISSDLAKKEIDTIISIYTHQNPEIVAAYVKNIHNEVRAVQANDFASNKKNHTQSHNFRWGIRMPADLIRQIEKKFPQLFINKQQFRWFMQTFPAWRVPEKT